MSNVKKLFFFAILLILMVFASFFLKGARKNVILITVDTLRADHLSFYGYQRQTTPNLEQYAREGLVFERFYTTSPATGPAHASILTGQETVKHGTISNEHLFKPPGTSLQMALRSQKYKTAAFVSSVVVDSSSGYSKGFELFDDSFTRGEIQKNGDFTLKSAEHWITKNKNQNFFTWIHLADPYRPHIAPNGFRGTFVDEKKARYKGGIEELQKIDKGELKLTEQDHRDIAGYYDEEILYTDAIIGEFLNWLKAINLYNNTIIILTSDHGDDLYEHNDFSGHEGSLFNTALQTPLLILNSGVDPQVVQEQFFNIDIFPTVCSLLGITAPKEVQGIAMIEKGEVVQSEDQVQRSVVVVNESYENVGDENSLALISWPWKIVKLADGTTNYLNIAEDPEEKIRLTEETVPLELRERLQKWMTENRWLNLRAQHPAPPERIEKLKKQGYLQ